MRHNRKGFTIIELMIATVVFSLILLVIMGAIIQFGRIYYKGVIQSRTQERARAISEDIAKHIQFGKTVTLPSAPDPDGISYFCAGGRGYTFDLRQLREGNDHGLVTTGSCAPYAQMSVQTLAPGTTEMLGERMQLVKLELDDQPGDRYDLTVRVVYGENGDFEGDDPANACKSILFGGQFCAVSELRTTVTKRLK